MTEGKINWPEASEGWGLGSDEIHVWAASLAVSEAALAGCASALSADETERANRFRFARDRDRFIAGRGWLRVMLGRYLERRPEELKFAYSPRGKPSLTDTAAALHFNLAHCEDLALLAVTHACSVGVDVERTRSLRDADSIAERFFSPRESEGLKALPDSQKPVAFFNLWTRKEAWLKATGEGISDSLNQVEVSFLAGEPARVFSLFGDAGAAQNWMLETLNPAPDFVGALAARRTDARLTCRRWDWEAG